MANFRTDNGGEYVNKKFDDFCVSCGIKIDLTTLYSPQHNNIAERKNRTIMEMARTMFHAFKVPKFLWAEAMNIVVHILNRVHTKFLHQTTPHEF